jgi:hypothetical protein
MTQNYTKQHDMTWKERELKELKRKKDESPRRMKRK